MSILQRLRERFWFLPALFCLAAFGLAEGLVALDQRRDGFSVPGWAGTLLYSVGASGSRDVLGAIASSSLAVAGTTFSITMAVLALTSSTYGPRLIRNFMSDRGNQAVLGVFVATFLYSLLVLRSIRVVGDSDSETFVPHLAVNAAVLLAVADVAVLIWFIHHISDSIQISTLTARVRDELRETIERVYPPRSAADSAEGRAGGSEGVAGGSEPGAVSSDPAASSGGAPVHAENSGYVQYIDEGELVRRASRFDVVVVLLVRPGQYVLEGEPLALVHPASTSDEQAHEAVGRSIHLAGARTPHQDPEFAVQQLTEMAVRALSPGTNDPYTARNALDDLSSGLSLLATRAPAPTALRDRDDVVRVHVSRAQPADLVGTVIDAVRWYATSAPSVMHAALDLVDRVGERTRSAADRASLGMHVGLLEDAFAGAGHHAHDVRAYRHHATAVHQRLSG